MARVRNPFGLFVAILVTILVLLFIKSIADILLLFFIAVLFSLYLHAITDFLEQRLDVPRVVGLCAALIFTLIAVGALVALIVPPVLRQTQDLLIALPGLLVQWQQALIDLASDYPLIGQLVETTNPRPLELDSPLATLGQYFTNLFPYLYSVLHLLILLVSVVVMGVYMTLRPSVYETGFIRLLPPVHRDLGRDILRELSITLRAWIVGQLLAMVFLGVLTWIGLLILQVPYALAFAVFTGVVVVVPFFGTLVSTVLPALFVLGSHGLLHALLVVLLGVVIHLIEANLVHPMIMERQVHLPPVLSILSVLVMAELLGPIGLLVAVPTLATVMVVVRRLYVERILEGRGFRRKLRPPGARMPAERTGAAETAEV
ncbi:MAG TPA: AI-2E family transporter [Longimicrobiaceae bacterium]